MDNLVQPADYKSSLVLCVIYYVAWMYVLPYFGKYTIRQETLYLDNEGNEYTPLGQSSK